VETKGFVDAYKRAAGVGLARRRRRLGAPIETGLAENP
jgi:hypothetical protein